MSWQRLFSRDRAKWWSTSIDNSFKPTTVTKGAINELHFEAVKLRVKVARGCYEKRFNPYAACLLLVAEPQPRWLTDGKPHLTRPESIQKHRWVSGSEWTETRNPDINTRSHRIDKLIKTWIRKYNIVIGDNQMINANLDWTAWET